MNVQKIEAAIAEFKKNLTPFAFEVKEKTITSGWLSTCSWGKYPEDGSALHTRVNLPSKREPGLYGREVADLPYRFREATGLPHDQTPWVEVYAPTRETIEALFDDYTDAVIFAKCGRLYLKVDREGQVKMGAHG